MADYEYQTNIYKKTRRWHHTHRMVTSLFVLGLILIGSIGYIIWRNVLAPTKEITGGIESSVFTGDTKTIVQSDHFAFESSLTWEFLPDISSIPTKYVYHSVDKGLVKHEFTVYLGTVSDNLHVTYVLPVSSPDGKTFIPGILSPKCSVPPGANLNPLAQTYEGILFTCIPDRNEMIIAAGQSGNGYNVEISDLDERTRTLGFFYRDLTAKPSAEPFSTLIRSFKLK